jgi:hypothetical protein
MRGAIPPLSHYASMAWCSVKKEHRDQFTFTLPLTQFILLNTRLRVWMSRMPEVLFPCPLHVFMAWCLDTRHKTTKVFAFRGGILSEQKLCLARLCNNFHVVIVYGVAWRSAWWRYNAANYINTNQYMLMCRCLKVMQERKHKQFGMNYCLLLLRYWTWKL